MGGSPQQTGALSTQPKFSTTKFRDYALKWTNASNADRMNPNYPIQSNNCANFASQALHAGGWPLRNGINPRDTGNWHYNLTGPLGASRTWVNSGTLYYTSVQAGWAKLSSIYKARTGDLLFVDWDPKGRADGDIDHVMVVTGYSASKRMPLISQKSSNRHNIPLSKSISLAKDQGKTFIKWYGMTHK